MQFLTSNNIYYSGRSEIVAFIDSFEPKHPARLSYTEFLDVILVNRKLNLRQKALQRSKRTAANSNFKEFLRDENSDP
jgi:hypothetical protein